MKKVTVTLDDRTAARALLKAAKRHMTLARYISETVRKDLRRGDEYEAAYRAWREDRQPWPLKGPAQRYPTRDEIYDRKPFVGPARPSKNK